MVVASSLFISVKLVLYHSDVGIAVKGDQGGRWAGVACDERQKEEGHKFWHNAYWKTELAMERND